MRIGARDFNDLAEASVRIGAASVQQSGARNFKDLAEASVQTAGASVHPSSGIGAGAGAGIGAASVRPMPTQATRFGLWPDLIRGDQAGREQPLHGLFKPPLRDALGLGLAEHQAGCVVPGGRVVTDAAALFPRASGRSGTHHRPSPAAAPRCGRPCP